MKQAKEHSMMITSFLCFKKLKGFLSLTVYPVWMSELTKNRWLFVSTYIMKGLIKQYSKLLCYQIQEVLPVLVINETVKEDTITLMNPKPSHGILCVMKILVSSQ